MNFWSIPSDSLLQFWWWWLLQLLSLWLLQLLSLWLLQWWTGGGCCIGDHPLLKIHFHRPSSPAFLFHSFNRPRLIPISAYFYVSSSFSSSSSPPLPTSEPINSKSYLHEEYPLPLPRRPAPSQHRVFPSNDQKES